MDEKQYLDGRLEHQIAWYDKRSRQNRRWCVGLRMAEIVSAALIPLLTGLTAGSSSSRYAVAALGVLVAIAAGALSLFRFQELWIQYRSSSETLKHEKFLFLTRTEPYSVDQPLPLLVNRTEALISREHTSWSQYIRTKGEGTHG